MDSRSSQRTAAHRKAAHPDDLVRSDGRVTNPDGEALECGAWVTTVDLYLEMIRAECAEDGCCTGEDADHVDAELARPQYDD